MELSFLWIALFFFILSFNYLLSLHKWTPSTIRCEEDSIASHYGNNFEHCSSGPLHNGYCTMDKPWNNIFNHQRKRSYFQWLHLHVSSLRGYTWTVYIKHVQFSGHILYSGISYLGLLSKDSIASSPAFLRRRYIVIECSINLMEPDAFNILLCVPNYRNYLL